MKVNDIEFCLFTISYYILLVNETDDRIDSLSLNLCLLQ